jgi:hypothetical protein
MTKLLIAAAFFVVIVPRFLWLDNFPAGMAHDEIEYTLNAKTFALHGTDLAGYGFPLGLFTTETEGHTSLLPAMILAPWFRFVPLTQMTAKIPYALIGLLTAFFVYQLTLLIISKKNIALLASLLFLMNPWSFFLSRFATESPFALLFYAAGSVFFLRLRGWKLVLPFSLLVMGFLSYHGAKIIFLPLIIVLLVYRRLTVKETAAFLLGAAAFFVLFFLISLKIPGSILSQRSSELQLPDVTKLVDRERQLSIPTPVTNIYSNKLTTVAPLLIEKYLDAFSPDVLFIHGDKRLVYSFMEHGLFYLYDVILLLAGLYNLHHSGKRALFLLAGLVAIAPLASALNNVETSYVHRSFLLLIPLTLLAAVGLGHIATRFPKVIIVAIMALFYANFLHFYFFRYSVFAASFYSQRERVLASFIVRQQQATAGTITVVTTEPRHEYLTWLLDANDDQRLRDHLQNVDRFNNGQYRLPDIEFRRDCPKQPVAKTIYIADDLHRCFPEFPNGYSILDPIDSGTSYVVYGSEICPASARPPIIRKFSIGDSNVEKMALNTFCRTWVSQN